ncbi:MAG TPA: hypothetical protein VGI10_27540, partial [Polyangiaceae bacterium]
NPPKRKRKRKRQPKRLMSTMLKRTASQSIPGGTLRRVTALAATANPKMPKMPPTPRTALCSRVLPRAMEPLSTTEFLGDDVGADAVAVVVATSAR